MPDRAVLQIVCIDCGGPVAAGRNRCAAHMHTPERAVVDDVPCAWCGGDGYVTGSMDCPECTTKPRAVVAISEDQQWLVVLEPPGWGEKWTFLRWADDMGIFWLSDAPDVPDTGQSADEVLASFLEVRNA